MSLSDARPRRTRRRRIRPADIVAQWPLMLMLAGIVVALAFVAFDRWRRAAIVLAIVALVAAVLRIVLAEHKLGLLVVRSRAIDVTVLLVLGGTILWLGLSVDALGT